MSNPLEGVAELVVNETLSWLTKWQAIGGTVTAVMTADGQVSDYTLSAPDADRLTPKGRYKLLCLQRSEPDRFCMKVALAAEAARQIDEGTVQ
ncbi:hypothetical protein [Novosphingobium subterraneum]|uniref:Uncharacterized protein n=1 Tax=Novosphingobium subterraneum TaxID=48936 RepID=A0A0B9A242_9SPHN|nr:hypothetical protein [Novosphingobium subterraneum]KHS43397.1 hypothetical protein NJ75_03706 [Novosphingobium subterraneum]